MKKNIKQILAIILSLEVIVLVGIVLISMGFYFTKINLITLAILSWASQFWIFVFLTSLVLILTSLKIKERKWIINAPPYWQKLTLKYSKILKRTEKTMLYTGIGILVLTPFLALNRLSFLLNFITVIGHLALLAILLLIIYKTYVFLVRDYFKKKRIDKANKIKELQRLETEEMERKNEMIIRESLENLPLKTLALDYVSLKGRGDGEDRKKIAQLDFEEISRQIEDKKMFSNTDLIEVCQKISHANCQLDNDFLILITDQCLDLKLDFLIFSTLSFCKPNSLPVLFGAYPNKKMLVERFLNKDNPFTNSKLLYDFLFNELKLEFKIAIFEGLTKILIFAWKKNWDIETLKLIQIRLTSLFSFANSQVLLLRKPQDAKKLAQALCFIAKDFNDEGIEIFEKEVMSQIIMDLSLIIDEKGLQKKE